MTGTFGPYTPIHRAGDIFFVSGQVGVDPATKQASSDIKTQTIQVLDNLKGVLASEGLALDQVVKTTIFITDIDDFAVVNEVYETYFNAPRPARSTVQVAALPKVAGETELLIEIEAVAFREPA
jgi:2-iminobutanoate/2-iminopropanoate deaminase